MFSSLVAVRIGGVSLSSAFVRGPQPGPAKSLSISAVLLQDLDLVAVGVLQEKETRHKLAVAEKLLDRVGLQGRLLKPRMCGIEIVDGERDVAVAIAVRIRLGAARIDRQFDFEVRLAI